MIDPIIETVLRNLTPQQRRDAHNYLEHLIRADKTPPPAEAPHRPTFKQPTTTFDD